MKIASFLLLVCLCSVALADNLTIDGITYQDVRFGAIRGTTVTIFHKTGVATVPIASLPQETQTKLGYDPVKAQAAVEQAAKLKSEQEMKLREAGYVVINGRWVSPQEASKYLDKETTSRMLRDAIGAQIISHNQMTGAQISQHNITLLSLISEGTDYHELDIMTENRRALSDLKKYGHTSYQPSIAEFLQVCDDGMEIYRDYETADPEWFKGASQFNGAGATMGSRPTSSAEMGMMASLGEKKARADAFYKTIEQLRKDARYHYQRGLDFKFEQDGKL
jgi:hypothetical protein